MHSLAKGFSINGTSLFIMGHSDDKDPSQSIFATFDDIFNPQSAYNEIHELLSSKFAANSNKIWGFKNVDKTGAIILNDNVFFSQYFVVLTVYDLFIYR